MVDSRLLHLQFKDFQLVLAALGVAEQFQEIRKPSREGTNDPINIIIAPSLQPKI